MAARLGTGGARGADSLAPKADEAAGSGGGLAFGLIVAALLIGGAILWSRPREVPAQEAPSRAAEPWIGIRRPNPLFDLGAGRFASLRRSYEAWRARSGPGRRDAMIFGDFASGSDFLRLSLTQPRTGERPQPFFASVARQAALSGLFIRTSRVPTGASSRFGVLSAADLVLEGWGRTRACLAFRGGGPILRVTGVGCGGPAPFGLADLACVVDRLDLIGGVADSPLTLYFAEAGLRRGRDCPAASGRRPSRGDRSAQATTARKL